MRLPSEPSEISIKMPFVAIVHGTESAETGELDLGAQESFGLRTSGSQPHIDNFPQQPGLLMIFLLGVSLFLAPLNLLATLCRRC